MENNLKTAAKIGAKSVLKWSSVFIPGLIITLIFFFVALFKTSELSGGGHGNALAYVMLLFTNNFFAFLLIFGAPVFIILYFILANKTSIQNAIYLLWQGKAGDVITAKVNGLVTRVMDNQAGLDNLANKAMLKAKLLHSAKDDDNTPKWQKRILVYGFKKIDWGDLSADDLKAGLATTVSNKFQDFISETTKPSLQAFWILVIIQLVLLIGTFWLA